MGTNHEDSAQVRRIQQWIERLEAKAIQLLDGLEIAEMTPKHQADVALKCLDHIQRFTTIEKRLQADAEGGDQKGLLQQFMRQARGEQPLALPDDDGEAGAARVSIPPVVRHEPDVGELQNTPHEHATHTGACKACQERAAYERMSQWIAEEEAKWRGDYCDEEEEAREAESWLYNAWWLDDKELLWEE